MYATVHVYTCQVLLGTRKTRPCLNGQPVPLDFNFLREIFLSAFKRGGGLSGPTPRPPLKIWIRINIVSKMAHKEVMAKAGVESKGSSKGSGGTRRPKLQKVSKPAGLSCRTD